jgi:hypothetical protein
MFGMTTDDETPDWRALPQVAGSVGPATALAERHGLRVRVLGSGDGGS